MNWRQGGKRAGDRGEYVGSDFEEMVLPACERAHRGRG